jgi:multidrug efflux pump subunit AcrA (membrane-fusion protein)
MKKKKSLLILLVILLVVFSALLLYWILSGEEVSPGRTGPAKQDALRSERTGEARIENITEYYDAVGTVEPRTQARIEAQISAQVTDVRVNAGESVKKGDLLVVLDDRRMQTKLSQARQALKTAAAQKEQARQAINAAEAAFTEAQSAYDRIKNFYEKEAATEQELEQARSRFLQAEAALKRAKDGLSGADAGVQRAEEMVQETKIALGYTEIRAPADAEVLKRQVDPGDLAMPGKPLLLLRTQGGLRLEAHVRESLIQKVHPGTELRVTLTTLDKTVSSTVEELIPYADPRTRTFLVKTRLPDVANLYPGMYGKLLIPYQEARVILVPQAAVNEVGQLANVTVKTAQGWQRRYIKTGKIYEDRVEVLSGLSGDETLLLERAADDS